MQKLKWRVIYGYSATDYIQIGEDQLEKAKYCMVSGKVFSHAGKMRRGSEIKGIEPDYRFYTGWSDSYEFGSSEDMRQIERDCPMKELNARYELADNRVRYAMLNKKVKELLSEPNKLLA